MSSISLTPMPDNRVRSQGAGLALHYEVYPSPFGDLLLASTDLGLTHALFDKPADGLRRLEKDYPKAEITRQRTSHHSAALSYFSPAMKPAPKPSPLTLALKGTPFQHAVWQALLQVPMGQTASYQQIGLALGKPKASRAVGGAVGKNPATFFVPCHRILAHNGGLGGYYWGLDKKRELLRWEGVAV